MQGARIQRGVEDGCSSGSKSEVLWQDGGKKQYYAGCKADREGDKEARLNGGPEARPCTHGVGYIRVDFSKKARVEGKAGRGTRFVSLRETTREAQQPCSRSQSRAGAANRYPTDEQILDTATTSCYRGARLHHRPDEFEPVLVPEHGTPEQCADYIAFHVWDCRGHRCPLTVLRGEGQRAYCFLCVQEQMQDKALDAAQSLLSGDFVIYDT